MIKLPGGIRTHRKPAPLHGAHHETHETHEKEAEKNTEHRAIRTAQEMGW
jgi:hypothetical protein